MEGDTVEDRLRAYFREHPLDGAAVYLFGSTARGEATASSDVDVAVLLGRAPEPGYGGYRRHVSQLEGDLERVLGRAAQVVLLDRAPPDLVHRVLRDGRLVHEPDRSARVAFEVRLRNEYFDLQPILAEYRRARTP